MSRYDAYLGSLIHQFWDYVGTLPGELADELESSRRDKKRPPVFRKSAAARNILIPPAATPELQATVEATLPGKERYRYFGSLRSSQALAQSVFGNLITMGKAALLEDLETEEHPTDFSPVASITMDNTSSTSSGDKSHDWRNSRSWTNAEFRTQD
ncbi:MAG: hypothetical protein WCH04_21620 [Gammaproteobacteria bacterium]